MQTEREQFANITTIMENTKLNRDKNVRLVERVMVAPTLASMPHGLTARFGKDELGCDENTLRNALARLNKGAGQKEFSCEVRGDCYVVTRL